MDNDGKRPSLLVFSDDWGRHPSSCQHLVRQLLPRYDVSWINTIGMRRPTLNAATIRRGLEKIGHWFSRTSAMEFVPDNPTVISPKMWPWFSRSHDRRINRTLLTNALRPMVASLPRPVVAVTTIPIVADLIGELPIDRWVYYCVDDFGEWPGLDHRAMRYMEERLVEKVDTIVAASENLRKRLANMGRSSELLTHGVDLEHWHSGTDAERTTTIDGCDGPLVVFWGVIDRRMDVQFLTALSNRMDQGTILLVGPTDDPDPMLFKLPHVTHVPPMAYAKLPELAAQASVLIMPYADLPVTRAMQPLKLKEYLATGKPAVVRDLPANRVWKNALDLASSAQEFSDLVRERIVTGLPPSQAEARRPLIQESWSEKARQLEQLFLADQDSASGRDSGH